MKNFWLKKKKKKKKGKGICLGWQDALWNNSGQFWIVKPDVTLTGTFDNIVRDCSKLSTCVTYCFRNFFKLKACCAREGKRGKMKT